MTTRGLITFVDSAADTAGGGYDFTRLTWPRLVSVGCMNAPPPPLTIETAHGLAVPLS